MQDTPAPKKRDYSGRVYKPRTCEDCPVVFTPGSSGQKRCADCQQKRNRRLATEKQKQYYHAKREARYCDMCGTELPVYWGNHSRHCDTCRPVYKKQLAEQKREQYRTEGRIKEYQRRYKAANPDQVRESARRWRQANPDKELAAIHRRRMRVEAGKLDELDRMLSTFYRQAIKRDPCFYCGSADVQCVDHYFAIAKGGSDHWFNLVRACRKCNLSKRTMCGTAFLLLSGG